MAGRQQDRSHYRVYFIYEYSTTLVVSLLFSGLLFNVVDVACTELFAEPTAMLVIAYCCIFTYLWGAILLHKTVYRCKFYFQVALSSFLYLFYVRCYPLASHNTTTAVFITATLNYAVIYLNKFCFQFDRLMVTLNNGLDEVMALTICENLRNSVHQDLEDDLRDEIYDQARRHKLKQVKDRRRSLGLPVEEFDDLSEEDETRESLQNSLRRSQ